MSHKKILTFKNVIVFFFVIFSFFTIFSSFSTSAQDVSELQKEITARNEQIKKLQAEIDSFNNKVATTQAEAKTLKAAIAKLESQKKDLLNQIALTNLKIQNTEEEIFATVDKIEENQYYINKNREALARILTEMKMSEDANLFVLNLINAGKGSLTDKLDQSYKLLSFNDTINEKIWRINGNISDLDASKSEYEKYKNNLASLSQDLSSRQDLVAKNQKDQNSLLTQTKNQEKEYQKIITDRESKVKSLQNEINSFESKIKYILDKSKLPDSGALVWPVDTVRITQHFGNTEFAQSGAYNGNGHNGMDFGVAVGSNVYAAAAGSVVGVGDTDAQCKNASYGKWVLIKHKNGLATLYGHLSAIHVSAGQVVGQGEKIGLSGNTGYSTGPHLHFTVVAADAVKIFGPTEYKSRTCGTYMVMPYAPLNAYLNPMEYLPK